MFVGRIKTIGEANKYWVLHREFITWANVIFWNILLLQSIYNYISLILFFMFSLNRFYSRFSLLQVFSYRDPIRHCLNIYCVISRNLFGNESINIYGVGDLENLVYLKLPSVLSLTKLLSCWVHLVIVSKYIIGHLKTVSNENKCATNLGLKKYMWIALSLYHTFINHRIAIMISLNKKRRNKFDIDIFYFIDFVLMYIVLELPF